MNSAYNVNPVTYQSGNAKLSSLVLGNLIKDIKAKNFINSKNTLKLLKKTRTVNEFNSLCKLLDLEMKLKINNHCFELVSKENGVLKRYYNLRYLNNLNIRQTFEFAIIPKHIGDKLIEDTDLDVCCEVNSFRLKKKNKKDERIIYSLANSEDKLVHRKINNYINHLQKYYFYELPVFSYMENRSYKGFLELHCGNLSMLKIDIKDFFPSVTNIGLETELERLKINETLIRILIRLSTVETENGFCLAQGLPLAASLSNLYLVNFDEAVNELCESLGLVYTRYSDDILISSSNIDYCYNIILSKVEEKLLELNLSLNEEKVLIQRGNLKISGILIRSELNIPSNKIKKLFNLLLKVMYSKNIDEKKECLIEYYSNRYYYDVLKYNEVFKINEKDRINEEFLIMLMKIRGKIEYFNFISPYQYQVTKLVKILNAAIDESRIEKVTPLANISVLKNVIYLVQQDMMVKFKVVLTVNDELHINIDREELENCDYVLTYVGNKERRYEINKSVAPGNVALNDFLLGVELPDLQPAESMKQKNLIEKQCDYYWRRVGEKTTKKINECFDSTGFEKNIAIIGEYGSGKSTLIDEYKKLNQEKVIDVSLMSTLQKSKNEYSFGNNDLSKNLDILNNIYQILMYNLVPMDDYPEFYPDSLKAKKNRSDAIFILIISISTIVLWTQITDDPHLINSFDHGLLVGLLICSILVIAVICVINILKFFIMFNNFKLKKLILSTSNAGLELDEKDSVKNEEQFVQGLICFLDLYMKTHKLNKIIINFEDLDRVAGPITIEFLRELNIKLNTLMSRKNVVFLYSIRTGILEKDSKKGVNTRARTKFEKYFNYTIYLKSINTRHYKSFILDLKEIEEDESLELYMKKDANLVNIIEQCFQQTSNNYAKTNIELFTDFRVYKSYLKELTFNLNSFVESVEVTNLSQKIEISISGIIEATMMLFASKHAADFIEYYFEILDNYNPNVIKVNNKYEVKRLQLIKSIEKRIINKYTVSNDEIFSKMEIAFFNKFLELDSISTIKLHEKYEFLNIISIDPEEIYFKKADVNYLTYKNLLLKEKEVINLYETAISIEQNMYKEKFIQRPNVYLTKKFDQYIDLFDMKKEEKSNVIDIWIKTSLDNEDKVDACFINLLDEEFAFGLLYGTGEVPKSKNSSVIRFLEQNSITKSKSKTFKSKFDEVVVIVAEANKKICDNNFDKFEYKKILHDLLQRKSGITRNSLTGQLGDKVEQDYYKYNPEHKGNYIRKKSVQVVYDNLDY